MSKIEIKDKNNIMIGPEYYRSSYDSMPRLMSYFHQLSLAKSVNPQNILEVGPGNKTVYYYLKNYGLDITCCDKNARLGPDCVADIRNLPFFNNSFDLVLACQILEHLPWDDVVRALNELFRISKKHVIISVPYASLYFSNIIQIPQFSRILKKGIFGYHLRIPLFFRKPIFSGEHYWEIGLKGYSKKIFKNFLEKQFVILNESMPPLNTYHIFFVLQKKRKAIDAIDR